MELYMINTKWFCVVLDYGSDFIYKQRYLEIP